MLRDRPRRPLRLHAVIVVTAVAVLASCGGSDSDGGATPTTTPAEATDAPITDTTLAADDEPAATATTDAGEQDGEDSAASEPGASPFPWLPEIAVLTQPSDDLRPLLEWDAIDGAVEYSVTVSAPDGRTYWACRTTET